MQKNLLLITVMLLSFAARAQKANMIFFAPNEEKFYLVVNGVQQNEKPLSNVKITGMSAPMQYLVKVKFEDTKLGVINDKVSLQPDTEKSWSIKAKKGGEYVIRTAGEVDKEDETPVAVPAEQVIVYHTEPTPGSSMNGEGISINMNMNEQGGNFSMNVNGGSSSSSSTTTTTTTSTTSSGSGAEPIYTNNSGCAYPMSPGNFSEAKKSIKDADFENTKLSTAKSIVKSNCVSADQVAEICNLFDFEATKLEFAKFAYSKTYDKNNYFKVNRVFDFDASKEELSKYTEKTGN